TDSVKRVLHHADVSLHPRMLVALDRNELFSATEGLLDWRRAISLSLVPFRIQFRCRVNVVLCSIAVGDADFLVDHYAQYVRRIVAAILIELDWSRRYRPAIVANLLTTVDSAFPDIDKGVRQLTVFNDRVVG